MGLKMEPAGSPEGVSPKVHHAKLWAIAGGVVVHSRLVSALKCVSPKAISAPFTDAPIGDLRCRHRLAKPCETSLVRVGMLPRR